MDLNYSKEDVELLLDEAEKMIMNQSRTCENSLTPVDEYSSDSDYESKASRDLLIQSEPNISRRRVSPLLPSQRRKNKTSNVMRRDWRHSLPECLEYFNIDTSDDGDEDDGRDSKISLPLSDLWEHDQFINEASQDQLCKKDSLPADLANFGEDYSEHLFSDTEESDLDISQDDQDYQSNQDALQYFDKLQNISRSIDNLATDLLAIEDLIVNEDKTVENGQSNDDDLYLFQVLDQNDSIPPILIELFQQAKSHMLEISNTLFSLNIDLHSLMTEPPLTYHSEVESKLRSTYYKWQLTFETLKDEELRHQQRQLRIQQDEFRETLINKLSRYHRTKEFVNNIRDKPETSEPSEAGSWWNRFLKYSIVSGVICVTLMSSSYFWSYNKCQQSYYSSIWPLLTFSSYGMRPY